MIKIDLDKLTEAELIELNHKIVARLQFLNQKRKHEQMLEFKIGERVSFQPDGYDLKIGILTRYNKKTVTIITEVGEHWNVSPSLIQKVKTSNTVGVEEKNVVQLFKK
jgi:hypothetical protein